ncbi:uncharacterized protein [Montipora foliosa]|uniref:uncharacterized protein n=1 Tax=Montipora foliosa TaxID=591990 RepID=UPI0035F1FFF9
MSTWNPFFSGSSSCELQEGNESRTDLEVPSRKLKVTLLSSEWKSTKGGLSTINRELAIQLAKHQNVEVSMYLPCCSEEDVRIAGGNHVKLIQAKELIGYEPMEWLLSAPENHGIDYVIGHGLKLGRQIQLIQRYLKCKWVQVVHTAPEDLGMFEGYANAISRAEEKHKAEIKLCELADEVVAIGPKLADEYSRYLRHCQRDQSVFKVTPSIFSEFSVVKQAAEERRTFCVLVFGRGDTEDFELKGYDIAAKAISELNEESYEVTFVGAPPGKEKEVAAKLCHHGIARRQLTVRSFKESREYLGRLFCEVDLCIMPSRTEGFGLAALEALSAGLPILVSRNSGLGYALQDVPLGSSCVVNSEDPKEWAKAIEIVRKKSRNVRLEETEILRTQYAKKYCWKEQCDELVKMMFNNIFGTHAVERGQDSSLTRKHLPSIVVSESYVESTQAGINLTEKQGKRPSHPSDTPPSKKRRHDTDIYREIHHASSEEEASSMTSSHLATTVDTQARKVYEVPHGSSCVVNSEDPKEWARAIKIVCKKRRDVRLKETKDLCIDYAEEYSWEKQCGELVGRMLDSIFGTHQATEGEQESPLTRCHLPTTVVFEGYVEPTDKKGKRPLHPSVIPPSKKQGHDTDICRGTRHAGESEQDSSLPTPMVAEASVEPTGAHLMGSCHALFPAAIAYTVVVRELLRQVYKRRAEFSPLPWSKAMKLHLDQVYTRLKIVSRPKKIVRSTSLEIDLGNIFSCEGEGSMALAEGNPGIGKTTLCLKLAYDWANESMPSTSPAFELVFLLKCRDLDGDIMEAISEQLLPDDIEVKTKEGLLNFITDPVNQERILIILDGLDELPEKSQDHVSKLLDRKILPLCYVLATTRQERGIEARKEFAFDICLQIEGFTEEDSFEYIRKHFKNIDPSKGERLIEETKENTLLHALRNNPLNLLLLCVVYEDHEGKLPSSRTNLFQIIVRCLLRRYCEKNSVKACEEDSDLEKQFEANILVLGELAWECLLNYRHSFREDELTKLERSDDKLVVRYLGLVFKEESLKRLKPNHEYFFLHKSFQEYLAASYIAHKLRRNQFNVFEDLSFTDLCFNFPQVFLFVCGILREEASVLFTQIGENLKGMWDWLECSEQGANFFVESFSESGNPERMADALFRFIPFPRVLHLSLLTDDPVGNLHWNVVEVLRACTGFSKVQTPDVHIEIPLDVVFRNFKKLQSLPKIKNLDISYELEELEVSDDWESVAELLKTSKTLEKVTFPLWDELSEGWARALDAGLCADSPLSFVVLRIYGSLSEMAIKALENLLHNKSLSSLSIYICGDMQDSLAMALVTGLAGQIAVKVLDVRVNGKLGLYGANLIERGIVRSNSLTKLIVSLRGEVPDNWQAVGRNIHSRLQNKEKMPSSLTNQYSVILPSMLLGRETSASFALYPNTFGKVTAAQVTQCCPFEITDGLPGQQNVTLNVWGELGGDGAEALFEGLSRSPVSHLTLDIHGKLTDDILNSTARWVEERNTQASLTINTWEQLTKEEKDLFEELQLDKNPAVTLNVRDVPSPPEESCDNEFVSIDDLESLIALFKEAKDTGKQNLSATISIEGDSDLDNGVDAPEAASSPNFSREPEDGLDYVLASNTTLNALSLTFNDDDNASYSWAFHLGAGLALNTSLKNLTLTIIVHKSVIILEDFDFVNGMHRKWRQGLVYGLKRNSSLKNLTVIIENHSDALNLDLYIADWARKTSMENLFLTVNNHSCLSKVSLDVGFASEKSLKNLTLTINNFVELNLDWKNRSLENKSINDFSVAINNYGNLNVTDNFNNYCDRIGMTTFSGFLWQLKSLTTFNLTLNLRGKGGEDLFYGLMTEAMRSESLETLRLKVNDRQIGNGSRGYHFSDVVLRSPSLSFLELTFSLYGVEESSIE